MTEEIENIANEYFEKGWKMLTFSVTPSSKAILVFEICEEREY